MSNTAAFVCNLHPLSRDSRMEAMPRARHEHGRHRLEDVVRTTDAELVQRERAGDRDAYGHLVRRYQGAVHGLSFSLAGNWADAEDIAQDAFVLRAPGRDRRLRRRRPQAPLPPVGRCHRGTDRGDTLAVERVHPATRRRRAALARQPTRVPAPGRRAGDHAVLRAGRPPGQRLCRLRQVDRAWPTASAAATPSPTASPTRSTPTP